MPQWIIMLVVNFLLRQVTKFGEGTDWEKVKADAVARIAQIVPSWFLPSLSDIVGNVIDIAAAALADTEDLKDIVGKLISGDLSGALNALVLLVEKLIHTPEQYAVHEALKKMQAAA